MVDEDHDDRPTRAKGPHHPQQSQHHQQQQYQHPPNQKSSSRAVQIVTESNTDLQAPQSRGYANAGQRLTASLAMLVVVVISKLACVHDVVEYRTSVKSLNACGHGKKLGLLRLSAVFRKMKVQLLTYYYNSNSYRCYDQRNVTK